MKTLPELTRPMLLRMRLEAIEDAHHDLVSFAKLMRPAPGHEDDPRCSTYLPVKHHYFIASILERVARGELRRVIITAPPRSGKTELTSKLFPAWFSGAFPDKSLILATYSETFSRDFGRAVKDIVLSPPFRQVFPDYAIKTGRVSTSRIETKRDGVLFFTGVGGAITGRGGHVLIGDDLLKNREQADSQIERNKAWSWYTQVFRSRFMDDRSAILLIQTRWHEDDLVGRLTDPDNAYYEPEEAKLWTVVNLPAIAELDDPLGRKPGELLWPDRFGHDFLDSAQRVDPRGFSALYQGSPAALGGNQFKREMVRTYTAKDLPRELRMYASVDLAVSKEQDRDRTCIIPCGVDADERIFLMPDVWWKRAEADVVVEAIIEMILRHKPLMIWGERGIMAKSIGPFLRKRMVEKSAWTILDDTHPKEDKRARSLSIYGRMAQGKVYFPENAPWFQAAVDELLKFPAGQHDDFVDAMSGIGLGLMRMSPAARPRTATAVLTPGTFGYMKALEKRESRIIRMNAARQGW